jgi:nicotinate-nucleotide pyrophosphorylase
VTLNLSEIIRAAFVEDLPRGDLTTDQLGLGKRLGKARLIAKEDLVLAGAQVFT